MQPKTTLKTKIIRKKNNEINSFPSTARFAALSPDKGVLVKFATMRQKYIFCAGAAYSIIRKRCYILGGSYKRLVVLSKIRGVEPVLRAEKGAFGWIVKLVFDENALAVDFGQLIVTDGAEKETFPLKADTEYESRLDLYGGAAAGVIAGGELASYGESGLDMGRAEFEKRFVLSYDDDAIAEENYYAPEFLKKDGNNAKIVENADVEAERGAGESATSRRLR